MEDDRYLHDLLSGPLVVCLRDTAQHVVKECVTTRCPDTLEMAGCTPELQHRVDAHRVLFLVRARTYGMIHGHSIDSGPGKGLPVAQLAIPLKHPVFSAPCRVVEQRGGLRRQRRGVGALLAE